MLKDKHIVSICASHYASTSDTVGFSDFANWARHENLTGELKVILNRLGALRLLRQLNRVPNTAPQAPAISLDGETVLLDDQPIGKVVTWYRTVLPQEAQARIAYESLLDRFMAYIAEKEKVIELAVNDLNTWVFVPRGRSIEVDIAWSEFVEFAFSLSELEKSFTLLMNLHRLSAGRQGGLGYLRFPIVSRDQAILFAAYYYAVIEYRSLQSKEVREATRAVRDAQAKISEIQNKLKKLDANSPGYPRNMKTLEEWQKKLAEYQTTSEGIRKQAYATYKIHVDTIQQKTSPEWVKTIRQIAETFNTTAKAQLGSNVTKIDGLIDAIVDLNAPTGNFSIRSPLIEDLLDVNFREAGDKGSRICYVCGRLMRKNDKEFSITRLIFEKPTTRPQSGSAESKLPACGDCAAVALTSPFKLGESGVLVRLEFKQDQQDYEISIRDYVRMLTLGELNLAAGKYLLISCQDYTGKGTEKKFVMTQMGALQYALFKMASTMPREALRNVQVKLFDGSEQELPVRHLIWLNYLQEIFEIDLTYFDKQKNTSKPSQETFEAVRLIQKEEVVKAIYALICGNPERVYQLTDRSYEKLRLLEELRKEHCKLLEEADMPEKVKLFRDVAAMTGLLDAFCDYVRSEAKKAGKDDKNEVTKLIEEVTDPYQFIYRASHNLSGTMATMFRNDDNYFCFDSARAMLGQLLGEEINKREGVSDKGTRSLKVYFDDVRNAYAALFENDYKSEKEQKDFTTELKLSLAAKFPEYFKKE